MRTRFSPRRSPCSASHLQQSVTGCGRVEAQAAPDLCDDAWLHAVDTSWGTPVSNYFKWFHVFEDELNHRGQIRLLRKLLPADP